MHVADSSAAVLLALTSIGLLGTLCQWLAWWARMPAILFLLTCGILLGPLTHILDPDRLFGHLLLPAVSLSVAVILFEGSLTLRLDEIRGLGKVVRNLISVGLLLTWAICALATHYLIGFDYRLSFLFGAVVVVTGPTVIMPMLRTVRPNAKVANVLRWEGITIDPLGALFAVLTFDFLVSSETGLGLRTVIFNFSQLVLAGAAIGVSAALVTGALLRRHLVPEYLRNVFALTMVFVAFTGADLVQAESGLLAVTLMGITLANIRDTDIEDILDFKESLSVLLISALFIVLGARLQVDELVAAGWPAFGLLAVVMFVARPLAVLASTLGSDLNFKERALIAWIGPRGIVCAAVAAVFALRLEEAGYAESGLFVPLAFLIILGTVLIQSVTAKPLARWLDVREPPPTGFLVIGAGNVARALGKVLKGLGYTVRLTDTSWDNTRLARMEGLDSYFGNPISEHADTHLDLTGIGKMLAVSGQSNFDTLAALRFRSEFGTQNVYDLRSTREQFKSEKSKVASRYRGHQLFGKDVTHGLLASWLRNGGEVRTTQLTDEFNFEAYLARYAERVVPLFALDPRDRLLIFTAEQPLKPESGWKIVGLILPEGTTESRSETAVTDAG